MIIITMQNHGGHNMEESIWIQSHSFPKWSCSCRCINLRIVWYEKIWRRCFLHGQFKPHQKIVVGIISMQRCLDGVSSLVTAFTIDTNGLDLPYSGEWRQTLESKGMYLGLILLLIENWYLLSLYSSYLEKSQLSYFMF